MLKHWQQVTFIQLNELLRVHNELFIRQGQSVKHAIIKPL
jgi:hypothetical protein